MASRSSSFDASPKPAPEWHPVLVPKVSKPFIIYVDVVVVGDEGCGKKTLLNSLRLILGYNDRRLPVPMTVDNVKVEVVLWNTLGIDNDKFYEQRKLSKTDVLLLCYSIGNPDTFLNIQKKWLMRVYSFAPKSPIVIVGNKVDLRTNTLVLRQLAARNLTPVNSQKGQTLAKIIGATYAECSAFTRQGVLEVFEDAVRASLNQKVKRGLLTTQSAPNIKLCLNM